jgi:hypothetical protein
LLVLTEMAAVAFLGGTLTLDRYAGWGIMLSQPLVGSCLAGILLAPSSGAEIWALRVPLGIGALLQLLLTDASLPAAQRQHDTAAAGVIGTAVAVLGMGQLDRDLAAASSGIFWVVVGVAAGLVSAVVGGWVAGFHRARSRSDVARADRLAESGAADAFERLYWGGILRAFTLGALWAWGGTVLGISLLLAVLPRLAAAATGRRVGFVFAVLVGTGLAAGFHAHVRGRKGAIRWAALGVVVAWVLAAVLSRGAA